MMQIELAVECARELMNMPDAHMSSITMLDQQRDGFDGVQIELVIAPLCQTGKRKGKPNWRKATERRERLIAMNVLNEYEQAWQERTGLHANCMGTGKRFAGWHHDTGTRYVTCHDCDGSGSYPQASEVEQ